MSQGSIISAWEERGHLCGDNRRWDFAVEIGKSCRNRTKTVAIVRCLGIICKGVSCYPQLE